MSGAPSTLCPWLVCGSKGTVIIRGRARFPAGSTPPSVTKEATYTTGWDRQNLTTSRIPAGTVTWNGDAFVARFEGLAAGLAEYAGSTLCEAFLDRDDACLCYRVDSTTWEAGAALEERSHISGTMGTIVCEDGAPVAVEDSATWGIHGAVDESIVDTLKCVMAIIGTGAVLGPWVALPDGKGHRARIVSVGVGFAAGAS